MTEIERNDGYTVGVDFGTLSARAVVCRVKDGAVLTEKESVYLHGAICGALPDGTPIPSEYALQYPEDYIDALRESVAGAVKQSGVEKEKIIGLGMDFTCSVIPLSPNGVPMCMLPENKSNPHAYPKLWKHHGAWREAKMLTALLAEKDAEMLSMYGGRASSECFFARLLEIYHCDLDLFKKMDRFCEVGDWVCQRVTGSEKRSLSMAGFKAFYRADSGYPACILEAEPTIAKCVGTVLRGEMVPPGGVFGYVTKQAAAQLGLCPGIPVTAPSFDGHAALPASGIQDDSRALLSLGTSSCLIAVGEKYCKVKGICSMAQNGILPGMYAYAMGQAGFGDALAWFVRTCVPQQVLQAAENANHSVHEELALRASRLRPGESGLLMLDWMNGSKPLADTELSGLMLGMTLSTKPEEMYLAMLESLAFGIRAMLENYRDAGITPAAFCLGGGIAYKNPFFVQLICDICGLPLLGTKPLATPAVGMAMYAACAAGAYPTMGQAVAAMNCQSGEAWQPNMARGREYEPLYQDYKKLSDYFSNKNLVMHRLKAAQ